MGRLLLAWDRRRDAARSTSWADVAQALERLEPSSVSIDLFDTVLTRRVARDDDLWWAVAVSLGRAGYPTGAPGDFVAARRAAAEARPLADLDELYQQEALADWGAAEVGPDVERRIESEMSVAVPGARDGLARLRASGHRLSYVSDMHLAPSLLRDLLERAETVEPDERLTVSSAAGVSKSGGAMFQHLLLQDDPPRWHVGNDLWADVAMPERDGISAVPTRSAELSRLEDLMAQGPPSAASFVAAAARHVRSRADGLTEGEAALVEVGADVAGQALVPFLLWVREQCTELGLRDLCFMARDGELPLQMARAMPADHWEGHSLRYLQGNRRLWSIAAAAVVGVDAWLAAGVSDERAHLRHDQHAIPLESLLGRVALVPGDLSTCRELRDLPLDQPLPPDRDALWREFLTAEATREQISVRAARQFRYLQQLLESGPPLSDVGCVDVGWTGQMAAQVTAVLGAITGREPVHLHFGGVGVAVASDAAFIRRFAFDDSLAPLPFPDVVSCVETFTASGGSRATGLTRDEQGRVQLLTEPPLPHMDTPERRLLRGSAVEVARSMPSRNELVGWGLPSGGLDEHVRHVLTEFWCRPTKRQALALSLLTAEVDDDGISVRRVASPYRLGGLRRSPDRTWRQGSLRLTRPPLRLALEGALAAQHTLRRAGARSTASRTPPSS